MKSFIVCGGGTPVEVTDFMGVYHVDFLWQALLFPELFLWSFPIL